MNRNGAKLLSAVFLWVLACPAGRAFAAFENIEGGARSIAMGNAVTAAVDDGNAVYQNPAGLSSVEGLELAASYGKRQMGLSDGSEITNSLFSAAVPVNRWHIGTVGVGYSDLNLVGFYKESMISLTYSKQVRNNLRFGFNLNRFERSAEVDDYLARDPIFKQHGNSASAVGLDFGASYTVKKNYVFGAAFRNFNRPDVGLAAADRLPVEIKLGSAYRQRNYQYGLDFVKRGDFSDYKLGAERYFMRHFALRGGLAIGSENMRALSFGFGYRYGTIQVDYSFRMPLGGVKDSKGSHTMSLTLRFGRHPVKLEEVERVEERAKEGEPVSEDLRMLLNEVSRLRQEVERSADQRKVLEKEKAEERMQIIDEVLGDYRRIRAEDRERAREKREAEEARAARESSRISPEVEAREMQALQQKFPDAGKGWKLYLVEPGDTMESIAKAKYGDPGLWVEIHRVNRERVKRGGVLKAGSILIIPPAKK